MKKTVLLIFSLLAQNFALSQTKAEINFLLDSISRTANSKEISTSKAFKNIAKYNLKVLPILSDFFPETEITETFSECVNRKLTKGEIAIIVADQIKNMPYFQLTGVENCLAQFCDKNSNLIEFYLNYIKQRGNLKFINKYKDWLKSKDFKKN
jgi:hypothetical protein